TVLLKAETVILFEYDEILETKSVFLVNAVSVSIPSPAIIISGVNAIYFSTKTVGANVCLLSPHESKSRLVIIGNPSAKTVELPPVVIALQCLPQPGPPQQGCGVTGMFGTITGAPSARTVGAPPIA
ncbi:MAG: hypothetical protein GWN01_06730, partial [Nitrosopumilaceae archaeon]|nr:hypothetical protein [Nitrosopumilaceae archaeon]NIU87017.1 hypothetical protein [Nitrosopumilaceae archaeon]NIX61231.1 hypothetical protein [Nitrosopumilaceae archaeon]